MKLTEFRLKLRNKELFIIFCILFSLFSLVLFGITGLRTILGLLFLYLLPTYIILDNFDLEFGEKLIFSLFLSFTLYPTLVYWIGFFLQSLRKAMVVSFILLIVTGFLIKKYKKKDKKETEK